MDCILIATLNHYKLIQKRALHKQKMKVEITININKNLYLLEMHQNVPYCHG